MNLTCNDSVWRRLSLAMAAFGQASVHAQAPAEARAPAAKPP